MRSLRGTVLFFAQPHVRMRLTTMYSFGLLLMVPCLVGCLGWSGCARSKATTQAADVPADFTMVFGQGGGFAGLWSGYVIDADGRVAAWKGPVTREDTTDIGTLTPEAVAALWQQVQEAEYFVQKRTETGNMTSYIEVTAEGVTHRTSWVTRVEMTKPPPSPLEKLYDYSRALAQNASDK